MIKNYVFPIAMGAAVFAFLFTFVGSFMYTYRLVEFNGLDYSFEKHGIAVNGRTGFAFGSWINITDLEVTQPESGAGTTAEWCPGVNSSRGHITMGFINDIAVCADVAENQWLVPFKDIDGVRHYLVGKWPFLEEVTQPVSNSKLGL